MEGRMDGRKDGGRTTGGWTEVLTDGRDRIFEKVGKVEKFPIIGKPSSSSFFKFSYSYDCIGNFSPFFIRCEYWQAYRPG